MDDTPFTGLKPNAVPLVTDHQAGLETGITTERSVPDWAPHLSPGVPQYQPGPNGYVDKLFDSDSCVSFASLLGAIQAQANYLFPTLDVAQQTLLVSSGYVVNGRVRLSARWLAHASGTTRSGNSYNVVLETLRTLGCVPEADWAFTADLKTFDDWIARPVTYDALVAKGKVWLSIFDFAYDWLFWAGLNLSNADKLARVRAALPTCPVLVGRPWCPSCNPSQVKPNVPIKDCGRVTAGHATCITGLQADNDQYVRDTYPVYDRLFAADFHIEHAFRAVLTAKVPPVPKPKPPAPVAMCKLGDKTPAVALLQAALVYLGYLKAPSPVGAPYFGPLTQLALGKFQVASGIYPTAPDSFGPRSLAAMRAALGAV